MASAPPTPPLTPAPDTPETLRDIKNQKSVEYYAAGVNAWVGTRSEFTKQILGLSTLACGGMIATIDRVTVGSVFWWVASEMLFGACILISLITFRLNSDMMMATVRERSVPEIAKISDRIKAASTWSTACLIGGITLGAVTQFIISGWHFSKG